MQGAGRHVGLPRLLSIAWRPCWPNYAVLPTAMLRVVEFITLKVLTTGSVSSEATSTSLTAGYVSWL